MRIAGIYPQKIETDPKIQNAVSEPYGLQSILSIAKQEGHEVDLFLPAEIKDDEVYGLTEEEFIERITRFKPNVAAFSIYTCQYPMAKRVAIELKKRIKNLIVTAGNRHPTFLKEKIEEPFDFFVVKEGEETFKELLYEIENGKNYSRVKGIVFVKEGRGIYTGVRKRISDLDSLPRVLRFPIIFKQVYRGISIPPLLENPSYAIVEYSRCCYNHCNFCDNASFWGNRVVFRSSKKVVDEMVELKEKGVDIFYFMDLNFTSFPEKTREICKEMIKKELNVSWYCMSNIATLEGNEDLLPLMKKAGCYKIAWGVESTSDTCLEKINKKVKGKLTTNSLTIRILQKSMNAGIINSGFYIIGFPWETEKSILKDAEGLKKMPLHQLNIGVFTPIPLSRFFEEIKKDYKFEEDLEKYDRNHLIYSHKSLAKKRIKEIQKKLHEEFYESPEYFERIKKTCEIEPGFKKAFNDYFEFLGGRVRV